jgi:hypothetical protein
MVRIDKHQDLKTNVAALVIDWGTLLDIVEQSSTLMLMAAGRDGNNC